MREEEIIAKLLEIEGEERRRARKGPLELYNAGRKKHKKQIAFHKCKKRNRWVFGGNRSGKTECGAAECVYLARGVHPYRKNRDGVFGWVVSLSQQVQRDVAQKKVLFYLDPAWIEDIVMLSGRKGAPDSGIIDQIRVRNVFGGISVIGFKSCDQGREKFQGASLDFVWFDEEPPRDIYEECRMRVLDKKGDIFGTMTPLKGLTFLFDEIYMNERNDPEVWYEFMEWADNPFLDKEEISRCAALLGEKELASRRFGRFCAAEGLVYPEFSEEAHVISPFPVPHEWYDTVSIDPGLNNPLSAHWYAVDYDGNVYVIAEHYEAKRDIGYHAEKIKEISRRLGWHTDGKGRVSALIDPAANQRTLASAKSVSELFYEQGILVNTKVNKDLFSGIARVKSYLIGEGGKPKLYVFSNCVNMIREFKGYFWGSGDMPRKRGDHAMDELRYLLMTKPKNALPDPLPTPVMRDKQRLMRRLARRGGYGG
ncbi:MAG TPA: terminase family protein [Candidatus Borkfalkia stercoripullorum]|nr:terminase family protein [Candidatus Borkfalkia stercoripullorum]